MAIEKILINGKIYTENPDMPWTQAMAIDGKKLAYVGDNDGAKALAEPTQKSSTWPVKRSFRDFWTDILIRQQYPRPTGASEDL